MSSKQLGTGSSWRIRSGTLSLAVLLLPAAARPFQIPTTASPQQFEYRLGPEDEILVWALGIDELSQTALKVDAAGNIQVPLVGAIRASDRTPTELRHELERSLRKYVRTPEVTVTLKEFRSQPVSVIGEVTAAGPLRLQGRKTLLEVLSLAGGLRQDAGHQVIITRRVEWGTVPLPGAADDRDGKVSIGKVNLESLMQSRDPSENIFIMPYDVISVPRAQMVYVVGEVKKAGGFVLRDSERLSVLQALSLAEGLDKTAAPSNAKILRRVTGAGGSKEEIAVDIKRILSGKGEDPSMQPDDILFVPSSAVKSAGVRGLEAAIQMATGLVIWRR